ncbi:hypothetical protein BGZ49_006556, partial [Haplosporangium sp. Z 27]
MECAKEHLPGRVVGRSGVKPESELSILHMIRDLGKIKQLLKSIGKQHMPEVTDERSHSIRDQLVVEQDRFNTHAAILRETADREIEDLTPVPGLEEPKESWSSWSGDVKNRWKSALVELQTERQ